MYWIGGSYQPFPICVEHGQCTSFYGFFESQAYHDRFKRDVASPWDVGCILRLEILVEDWAVMATIRLSGEVKGVTRVLWECAHKSLQGLPHVWCCSLSGIGRQLRIWRVVCATRIASIVWTCDVWQRNDVAIVASVARNWDGVREASGSGLIDEQHVARIRPREGVVVYISWIAS